MSKPLSDRMVVMAYDEIKKEIHALEAALAEAIEALEESWPGPNTELLARLRKLTGGDDE